MKINGFLKSFKDLSIMTDKKFNITYLYQLSNTQIEYIKKGQ